MCTTKVSSSFLFSERECMMKITAQYIWVYEERERRRVCVYRARDKGISAQGVICVPLKFIMRSDSLTISGGGTETQQHILWFCHVRLKSCKVCETELYSEVRDD